MQRRLGPGDVPRIAMVGSGAIAEQGHLPALRQLGVRPALLVDRDRRRLGKLSARWGAPSADGFEEHLDDFDAAVVAVPSRAHAPVARQLLDAGKHVLIEKPLAPTAADADALVEAEAASAGGIHVGHMRRFLAVNRWVGEGLRAAWFGAVQSVAVEEGVILFWEAATDAFLRPEQAGGGALLDTGTHVLDILRWWLGDLEVTSYQDDNFGGVEANAVARLRSSAGVEITVELSRVRNLRNTARLECAAGTLEVSLHANEVLAAPPLPRRARPRLPVQAFGDLFVEQDAAWISILQGGTGDVVPGSDAARTVRTVEECYRRRVALDLPWMAPAAGARPP
jgi:predicted dehydrogenase